MWPYSDAAMSWTTPSRPQHRTGTCACATCIGSGGGGGQRGVTRLPRRSRSGHSDGQPEQLVAPTPSTPAPKNGVSDGDGDLVKWCVMEEKLAQLNRMNEELLLLNDHLQHAVRAHNALLTTLIGRASSSRLLRRQLMAALNVTAVRTAAVWKADRDATQCASCGLPFTLQRRKHHCRSCGDIFCARCCNTWLPLQSATTTATTLRVCAACEQTILREHISTLASTRGAPPGVAQPPQPSS